MAHTDTALRMEGTASAANAIQRVNYSHDAMIDLMIASPGISQNDLAKHFGYTPPWVSRVVNSDAFLARLAARKAVIVDPRLVMSIDEKLRTLASRSLDIVLEKLELTQNPDTALKAVEITSKALGYGARAQNVAVQQNFIVPMPTKIESAGDWASKYAGNQAGEVVEAVVNRV